ncbi:MAG: aminopeptidase P family protein [Desulfovibrionaceae bacterium]|nr:aminopeptidase P family protein [Desulfovibrionaceae bacterium]
MISPYAKRRDALRRMMQTCGLDAVLINYAANRYYLSGFELHDVQSNESAGYLVISASGEDYLATDPRYTEVALKVWPKEYLEIYRRNAPQALAKVLRKCGVRIGIETAAMNLVFFQSLQKEQKGLAFVPCNGLVEELRLFKDEEEFQALEQSFVLNHAMLDWLPNELRAGQTEREVAWLIECYFREHGASELAFPSIVAFNENAAMPHAIPTDKVLTPESLVLVDVGCRVQDYCSDQTRTFWFGDHPSTKFQETVDLVRRAQSTAMQMMKPGVLMCDVYAAARSVFEEVGEEEAFTHGLGHGVGLETHEMPSLSPHIKDVLEPGMVITVEPGLYYPDWGGVRWEYTVVVGPDGVTQL